MYSTPQNTGLEEEADFTGKIWAEFRSALRGRLVWAGLLGAGLAAGAGTAAWYTAVPVYKSTALMRVNSYTPQILRSTESTGILPRYENYLGAQVQVIRSHRVTDMAMQTATWEGTGRPYTPGAQRDFRKNLSVNQQAQSEIISIAFTDADRDAAGRATEAMVDAYLQVHDESSRVADLGRLRVLENRQTTLTEQLSQTRQEMQKLSAEYGLAGIESEYHGRISAQTSIKLELLGLVAGRGELAERAKDQLADVKDHSFELVNPEAKRLQADVKALEQEIAREERRGRLPNHWRVKSLTGELEAVQDELKGLELVRVVEGDHAVPPAQLELQKLDSQIATRREALSGLKREIEDLKAIVERLAQQKQTEALLQSRISETSSRIETLNLEASRNSRIEVLAKSDVSNTPVNASTIATRTAMAGSGGAAAGFLVVGGLGMLRRELRDSRDVSVGMRHRDLLLSLIHI